MKYTKCPIQHKKEKVFIDAVNLNQEKVCPQMESNQGTKNNVLHS